LTQLTNTRQINKTQIQTPQMEMETYPYVEDFHQDCPTIPETSTTNLLFSPNNSRLDSPGLSVDIDLTNIRFESPYITPKEKRERRQTNSSNTPNNNCFNELSLLRVAAANLNNNNRIAIGYSQNENRVNNPSLLISPNTMFKTPTKQIMRFSNHTTPSLLKLSKRSNETIIITPKNIGNGFNGEMIIGETDSQHAYIFEKNKIFNSPDRLSSKRTKTKPNAQNQNNLQYLETLSAKANRDRLMYLQKIDNNCSPKLKRKQQPSLMENNHKSSEVILFFYFIYFLFLHFLFCVLCIVLGYSHSKGT